MTSQTGSLTDWQVPAALGGSFARDYLNTYYVGEVTADEKVVLEFLAKTWKKVGPADVFVDLGCGPTIHHLLSAVPYVKELQAFDFVPECVEEVRKWRDLVAPVHNWNPWTKCALEAEGKNSSLDDINQRETELRSKLKMLGRCDLRNDVVLELGTRNPVIGCFYTTEQATMADASWPQSKRLEMWQFVMKKLLTVVPKGGWLLMSAVGYTDHYVTYDEKTKENIKHPLPYLTEEDFRAMLMADGFPEDQIQAIRQPVKGQEQEGVTDIILVAAKR